MFNNSWDEVLKEEMQKEYFLNLQEFINNERKTKVIFPKEEDVYNAFKLTDFNDIKVVILGQDPYHGEGEAIGLSFAIGEGTKMPPSLRNILKEYKSDIGDDLTVGDFANLPKKGVFLLNTVLTVEKDNPNSHENIGWQTFTDFVIKEISEKLDNVVFILWGAQARKKKSLIDCNKHYIKESVHPSPRSAYGGFLGSKPFSDADDYLKSVGKTSVFGK